MESGQVSKGARGMKKSKKVEDREMFEGANKRLKTEAQLKKEIEASNKKGIAGIKKRQLTEDEYQDFLDEVGGADQLEAYNFDGTVGDAQRIVKEQKEYMDDMFMEYKKGNLDPVAGDKSPARKKFLQNKLDEMEASGDKRLMTTDEIEELSSFDLGSEMDVAKSLAPKMVERLQLKQKYPGITDDLLDKILIDDNVQRKAEVIATMDEALKMMEKGKGSDEIIETFKNVTRTKQAAGGLTTMLGE
jgi:predicted RND superfamily exporter protein